MQALAELESDHRVFEDLLSALEAELSEPRPESAARVERLLRALLQGLSSHEAAETLLCAARAKAHPKKAALERERADFEEVREALDFVLESDLEENFDAVADTVRHLDERLRAHFKLQEETVWPALRRSPPQLTPRQSAELARHRRELARLKDEVLSAA